MKELRDLEPTNDPMGGSPKSPPRGIPVRDLNEFEDEVVPTLNPLSGSAAGAGIRELLTWAFRALVLLAFLYVKAAFVSIDKYENDRGKTLEVLTNISTTLAHVDEKLSKGVDTDNDHEKRLRDLEHGRATGSR